MVNEPEIDITPREIDPVKGTGYAGLKDTVFQEREWFHILNNPGCLTREGILEKIVNWDESNNSQVKLKYRMMLQRCERIIPSKRTKDGKVVLSTDMNGNPKWVRDQPNPLWSEFAADKPKR